MDYKKLPLNFTAASAAVENQEGTWPLDTAFWSWDDNDTTPYTPQGITSFMDGDTELIVVSWHADDGKGDARISYLQKNADGDYQYGHARLGNKGQASGLHAGGIAFFADRLLVAKTDVGVVTFDLTNPHPGLDGIWQIDQFDIYKLACQTSDTALRRFSFTDVDWSIPERPVLLTGAYVDAGKSDTYDPSVLGWALQGNGPVLAAPTVFLDTSAKNFRYMQGVAHFGDTWYLSQSGSVHQLRQVDGDLSKSSPKSGIIADTTMGLEDLHIPPDGKSLWGLTENADLDVQKLPRVFFQIPLPFKPA